MTNRWEKMETVKTLFSWAPKSLWMVTVAMKLNTCSLEEKLWHSVCFSCAQLFVTLWTVAHQTNLHSLLKSRDFTLPTEVCIGKATAFLVVVWMWELDHKEGWVPKNWCFWTVVLENTLESLLDCKEIKPVNPKGNQSWIFIGRTDAEDEAPVLWLPGGKSQLTGKDPDAGEDWGQEEKGMTEDEMVGWHHQLNRHEFEWTPGDGEGQGRLVSCSPWGRKESDTTEWPNNNNRYWDDSIGFWASEVDVVYNSFAIL